MSQTDALQFLNGINIRPKLRRTDTDTIDQRVLFRSRSPVRIDPVRLEAKTETREQRRSSPRKSSPRRPLRSRSRSRSRRSRSKSRSRRYKSKSRSRSPRKSRSRRSRSRSPRKSDAIEDLISKKVTEALSKVTPKYKTSQHSVTGVERSRVFKELAAKSPQYLRITPCQFYWSGHCSAGAICTRSHMNILDWCCTVCQKVFTSDASHTEHYKSERHILKIKEEASRL